MAKKNYKYIENHTSSEEDKSQDDASKYSIIKEEKIEDVDSKIEYEISLRKLIKKVEERQRIVWVFWLKRLKTSKWKDSNRKTLLRVKSYKEIFEMIHTHEIFYEPDCPEIEENKAEFVTTIMDLLDIYNDGDGTIEAMSFKFNSINNISIISTRRNWIKSFSISLNLSSNNVIGSAPDVTWNLNWSIWKYFYSFQSRLLEILLLFMQNLAWKQKQDWFWLEDKLQLKMY